MKNNSPSVSITMLTTYTLARRELVRFLRQRNRVFGALAQPVALWALFGSGLNASFRPQPGTGSDNYVEYFFPGVIVLILLFTAIFATISVIEDRNEGFLQSVLVAPAPTFGIVAGKLLGTSVLAVGQASLIFLLAPLAGIELTVSAIVYGLPLLALIALGLTGLGFTIAWQTDSTQGFHAIMTAFLIPMWLLSGAFFPAHGVPGWLAVIIDINPLTYGVAAFRHILYAGQAAPLDGLPGFGLCMAVTTIFTVLSIGSSIWVVNRD